MTEFFCGSRAVCFVVFWLALLFTNRLSLENVTKSFNPSSNHETHSDEFNNWVALVNEEHHLDREEQRDGVGRRLEERVPISFS